MKKYKGFINRTATLVRRNETIKELKKEVEDLSKAIDEIEKDREAADYFKLSRPTIDRHLLNKKNSCRRLSPNRKYPFEIQY
jgi:methyl coenzyme M reductase subunit C-like uncharacterized protein (methanogenesis marker protein 7)